jgi:hypothetical protein
MKNLIVFATAAFLFTGVAFAQTTVKDQKKAEGKECCKKDAKGKETCKKDMKDKEACKKEGKDCCSKDKEAKGTKEAGKTKA